MHELRTRAGPRRGSRRCTKRLLPLAQELGQKPTSSSHPGTKGERTWQVICEVVSSCTKSTMVG